MESRPKTAIKPERIDIVLEVLGWTALITLWTYIIISYQSLPDTIPIHFDMLGKPDDFGDKSAILGMPVIATFIFFILSIVQQRPQFFNFPVAITPENAKRQYTIGVRVMRILKGGIPMLFLMIELFSRNTKPGEQDMMLPVFFAFLFIPVGYLLIKALREK